MNLKLKQTPGIYVVGFTASGKSTVGRLLAHHLGWSFFDLDHELEAAEKSTLAEIFDTRGEAEFRRIEAQILQQHVRWIERGRPAVLAMGEGAFAETCNRELALGNGIAIWLDCPLAVVERRVAHPSNRPVARDPEGFAALYKARRGAYALADIHIAIESDNPERAVEAILAHAMLK